MCMFGYLKTPDIILPLVSLRKLDWTHTFDTHCRFAQWRNKLDIWGAGIHIVHRS